ncbi:MAG: flagellar export chaperone FlgN [Nitrospinae bacterium]|nr:flagellar export chaperone FlgN [Nitrospinota bacterium]
MSLANELVGLLELEHDLYLRLSSVIEDENEALRRWDVAGLDAMAREKEAVGAEITAGGGEIRSLLVRMAAENGAAAGEPTVGALAKTEKNPDDARRLLETREKLLATSARIAELNGANRSLVVNALGVTRRCIKHVNSLGGGSAETYLPGRMADEKVRPGLLLRRSY